MNVALQQQQSFARGMLVDVVGEESLRLALELCREHLDLVYFPTSIQGELCNRFPESPIRVFCYPSEEDPQYFFMVKDNLYIKPYLMLAHVPDTKFDRISYLECLREFRMRALGALDSNRPHLMVGKENLIKLYSTLMHNVVHDLTSTNLCLNLFYMDDQQREAILSHKATLPIGYVYSELDPDEEAEVVNKTWQHAKDGDLEQTHAKLRRMPSSCVRTDCGRPVAFEMIDPAGFMNNQYVYETHRRKGLGTAVEVKLAQKCIRHGMVPFKTVDKRNTVALNASVSSPFWTVWRDEQGKAVTVVFQEWQMTPKTA